MKSDLVRLGYDKVAQVYLDNRDRLKSGKYITQLLKYLPKHSEVLDLGCGAGVTVDDILLKAGHQVLGIDISQVQVQLARKNCPRGNYEVGNLADLIMGEYSVQGIVCLYTLFHLPRQEHLSHLKKFASFLAVGGMLLISMGDREFEGPHMMYGTMMWSSQYGTQKNRELVKSAGFKILVDEMDNSGGERHQMILAQKI